MLVTLLKKSFYIKFVLAKVKQIKASPFQEGGRE